MIASQYGSFGDFNIFKDSPSSFYIEFFYFEESEVPKQQIEEFIQIIDQRKGELGIQ